MRSSPDVSPGGRARGTGPRSRARGSARGSARGQRLRGDVISVSAVCWCSALFGFCLPPPLPPAAAITGVSSSFLRSALFLSLKQKRLGGGRGGDPEWGLFDYNKAEVSPSSPPAPALPVCRSGAASGLSRAGAVRARPPAHSAQSSAVLRPHVGAGAVGAGRGRGRSHHLSVPVSAVLPRGSGNPRRGSNTPRLSSPGR